MILNGPGRIRVAEATRRQAIAIAEVASEFETGGVLMGFRDGPDVCVVDVLEILSSKPSTHRYSTRERERNSAIEGYMADEPDNSPIGYVGTWHSHPAAVSASNTDVSTLRREALKAPDVVAMLVLRRRLIEWTFEGFLAHHTEVGSSTKSGHRLFRRSWINAAEIEP